MIMIGIRSRQTSHHR